MIIMLQKLNNGNNFAVCVCVCDDYSFTKASTFKPFVHNIQVNLVGLSSENVCVCDAGQWEENRDKRKEDQTNKS